MDDDGGARVLGVGVGLFLIILTWSLAVAGVLLLTRRGAGASAGVVVSAALVTLLLLIIPRQVISMINDLNIGYQTSDSASSSKPCLWC